jgi:two-component system chemotaxis response regulator CheY
MGINILIVDDSAGTRQVIERTIRITEAALGDCHHAGNGREALEILRGNWVDLIIMDLHMPEMDGRTLLHQIRVVEMWRTIPIAVVTSERSDQTEAEVLAMGATTYQKKPLTPEILKNLFDSLKARMP